MKLAKFDSDGVLVLLAENVPGLTDPSFVPVSDDADMNNLFLNADGVAGPRSEATLNCDRTVILNDGVDRAVVSGLPQHCVLMVNMRKTYVDGGVYEIASAFSGSVTVDITGAYYGNTVTVRVCDADTIMGEIRAIRDEKLIGTDWTQMADAPLRDDQKQAWAQYRTALRNITDDQPKATIDTVIWPTQPA
jgi:hypothetical protein